MLMALPGVFGSMQCRTTGGVNAPAILNETLFAISSMSHGQMLLVSFQK